MPLLQVRFTFYLVFVLASLAMGASAEPNKRAAMASPGTGHANPCAMQANPSAMGANPCAMRANP